MCYLVVKVGTLIWQVNTKRSNNKISQFLLVLSNQIAETYITGCVNRVQMESVFPDDSVLKGMSGMVLLGRC